MDFRFLSLLWHHWRTTWVWVMLAVLGSLGISLYFISISEIGYAGQRVPSDLGGTALMCHFTFLILMAAGMTNILGNGKATVMPEYSRTLPIGGVFWTRSLCFYVLLVVTLLSGVIMAGQYQIFGTHYILPYRGQLPYRVEAAIWGIPIMAIGLVAACQGVVSILSAFELPILTWVGGMAAISAMLGCVGVFPIGGTGSSRWNPLFWALITAVSYGLIGCSTRLVRHGVTNHPLAALRDKMTVGTGRRRDFGSRERALIWYDWSFYGKYVVLTGFLAFLMIHLFLVMDAPENYASNPEFIWLPIVPLVFIVVVASGLLAIRRYYDHRSGSDTFFLTLPLTTRRAASGRLFAAGSFLASVALANLALAAFLSVVFTQAVGLSGGLFWPGLLAKYAAILMSCWVLFWFTIPLFYSFIAYLSVSFMLAWILGNGNLSGKYAAAAFLVVLLPMLVLFVIFAWLAVRDRLVTLKAGAVFLLLWGGAWAVLYTLNDVRQWADRTGFDEFIVIGGLAFVLLPLPLLTTPLSIHLYRHR